jgi:hypothetical protein
MGQMKNAYEMLSGRPERKRPLGKPRYRWEADTKMLNKLDVRERNKFNWLWLL